MDMLVQGVEEALFFAPGAPSGAGSASGSSSSGLGPPIDAGSQYLAVPGDGSAEGGGETSDQARLKDLTTCFGGTTGYVRITRMRADLSSAALARDLVLQAASYQGPLSNLYSVTKEVNRPTCPTYAPCPSSPGGSSGVGTSGSGSGGGGRDGGASADPSGGGGGCACAVRSGGARDAWPELGASFLLGLSVWRTQRRRRGRRA
jgi:hypothetical protein